MLPYLTGPHSMALWGTITEIQVHLTIYKGWESDNLCVSLTFINDLHAECPGRVHDFRELHKYFVRFSYFRLCFRNSDL